MGLVEARRAGRARRARGGTGVAATGGLGQLGKAQMRRCKQRQYWDVAPWTLSSTMVRAMDLVEMLLDVRPVRRVKVVPDTRPATKVGIKNKKPLMKKSLGVTEEAEPKDFAGALFGWVCLFVRRGCIAHL